MKGIIKKTKELKNKKETENNYVNIQGFQTIKININETIITAIKIDRIMQFYNLYLLKQKIFFNMIELNFSYNFF